ncbi:MULTISPECIES: hypothetical protein [unclassified Streptomyces]|uniref:hypothetical protein n=1 Tax=unclassified Streptomyces TaxID=2593676 RepID=UPI00131BBF68|nr:MULTISPECIES: hypothetical protein [unclassified Streptomyces]
MTTTRVEPPPALPGTVFAASYLFAGVGALALVSAVGTFFAIPEFSQRRSEQAGDGAAGDLAGYGLTVFTSFAVVFCAICLVLAFLDARGNGPARVLTWIVGGLSVCFDVALLTVGFYDSVPWYAAMTRVVTVGMLLLTIGSVALLALPASHRYFRLTAPPRPPTPPPGHPAWPTPQGPVDRSP